MRVVKGLSKGCHKQSRANSTYDRGSQRHVRRGFRAGTAEARCLDGKPHMSTFGAHMADCSRTLYSCSSSRTHAKRRRRAAPIRQAEAETALACAHPSATLPLAARWRQTARCPAACIPRLMHVGCAKRDQAIWGVRPREGVVRVFLRAVRCEWFLRSDLYLHLALPQLSLRPKAGAGNVTARNHQEPRVHRHKTARTGPRPASPARD